MKKRFWKYWYCLKTWDIFWKLIWFSFENFWYLLISELIQITKYFFRHFLKLCFWITDTVGPAFAKILLIIAVWIIQIGWAALKTSTKNYIHTYTYIHTYLLNTLSSNFSKVCKKVQKPLKRKKKNIFDFWTYTFDLPYRKNKINIRYVSFSGNGARVIMKSVVKHNYITFTLKFELTVVTI